MERPNLPQRAVRRFDLPILRRRRGATLHPRAPRLYRPPRYRRRRLPTLRDQLDWSLSPDTAREVLGVSFTVLGVLFLISIFHLAGRFGDGVIRTAITLWGVLGYVAPLVLLVMGVKLLIPRAPGEYIKASVVIGVILAFLAIPGLFLGAGGVIGQWSFGLTKSLLGPIGGYVALLGIAIASLLVGTNISLGYLLSKLKLERPVVPQVNVHGPRANVFTMREREGRVGQEAGGHALTSQVGDWQLPPLELLSLSKAKPEAGNITKNVELIQKTLKDFGIEVAMGDVNIGPTVTQYTLKPAEGMKLSAITARANDLALVLAAPSVRLEAPIPGRSAVGVEIPNKQPAVVTLREILEGEEMKKPGSLLRLALGRGAAGESFIVDLRHMPHVLISGATGSGKSVCINAVLANLLFQNAPSDLRLILIDPKRVEFTEYNGIPHLLTPVVTEIDKTVSTLKWVVAEMERRFKLFADSSRRNVEVYNDNPTDGKLPYIVVIIDELADLMTQAANEVEATIVRIAQMARAVGIHLIVATQRPSVDVITGLIKANIPTRVAFAVASNADSRTIIDQAGAEKLLGRGDMLFIASEMPQPKRIQGVYVSDREIRALTEFLKREGEAVYDESIATFSPKAGHLGLSGEHEIDDDLFSEAKALVIQTGKASASLLQRRLRVGYARAARLLDLLEEEGVIGPGEGAKPRDVLVSRAGYDEKYEA